ncbi:hypothetical protein F2P79_008420 [Pimephales promelas]|nr:hypothetical protein F2P79_008420 [Pimephales promelas]
MKTDPVVMPPVPRPGPDMIKEYSAVISAHDRHDAVTETGRCMFQKNVLKLLVDIRHRLKETRRDHEIWFHSH